MEEPDATDGEPLPAEDSELPPPEGEPPDADGPISEEPIGNGDEPEQGETEPILDENELPPSDDQDDTGKSPSDEHISKAPHHTTILRRTSSTASSIAVMHLEVLDELKNNDEKAVKIARSIENLRNYIATYKEKEEISDEDALELKDKQDALLIKLAEFNEITKQVQRLLGLIDVDFSALSLESILNKAIYVKPHKLGIETERKGTDAPGNELDEQTEYISPEDKLPKIVVGAMQGSIPRIIVCDNLKKKPKRQPNICNKDCPNMKMSLLGTWTDERCCGKDKPLPMNLQSDGFMHDDPMLCRENPLISLQREVDSLEAEIDFILSENADITEVLTQINKQSPCLGPCAKPKTKMASYSSSPSYTVAQNDQTSACNGILSKLKCELNDLHKGIRGLKYEMGKFEQERMLR